VILDVDVVVAASRSDHPRHGRVRPWLQEVWDGERQFSVPDIVWAGFVRIVTNRRIFAVPTPVEEAFDFLRAVRAQPGHVAVSPGERHLRLFEDLCRGAEAAGDLAADAYIAAIALEAGDELVSLDRDFARFPGLRWRMPEG
jgi:toxin-antitoxin system PIN domain toxin